MALEREYDDDFEAGSCVSSVLCWHNAAQTMLAASLVNQSIVNSDPVPDVLLTDSLSSSFRPVLELCSGLREEELPQAVIEAFLQLKG